MWARWLVLGFRAEQWMICSQDSTSTARVTSQRVGTKTKVLKQTKNSNKQNLKSSSLLVSFNEESEPWRKKSPLFKVMHVQTVAPWCLFSISIGEECRILQGEGGMKGKLAASRRRKTEEKARDTDRRGGAELKVSSSTTDRMTTERATVLPYRCRRLTSSLFERRQWFTLLKMQHWFVLITVWRLPERAGKMYYNLLTQCGQVTRGRRSGWLLRNFISLFSLCQANLQGGRFWLNRTAA